MTTTPGGDAMTPDSPRQRWRTDLQRLELAEPGQPFVRLVILCEPCERAGRKRTLAVAEMDTGSDDRTLWLVPRRVPGNSASLGFSKAIPVIQDGRVKLICAIRDGRGGKSNGGCRNTPEVPLAEIAAELSEIWAPHAASTKHVIR